MGKKNRHSYMIKRIVSPLMAFAIALNADSSLTIKELSIWSSSGTSNKSMTLADAKENGILKLINGKIDGDTIVYEKGASIAPKSRKSKSVTELSQTSPAR